MLFPHTDILPNVYIRGINFASSSMSCLFWFWDCSDCALVVVLHFIYLLFSLSDNLHVYLFRCNWQKNTPNNKVSKNSIWLIMAHCI